MTATPPRRLAHRLSAAFVRTAEPGFYCDGHGLNLRVDPSGARQWVQRLVIRGRPRMLGLGGYPLVSLAEARNVAFANRQRARAGGDPLGREAPRPGRAHGRGGRRRGVGAAAPRLAQCQARAGLAAQSARLCVPAHRGAARVRGDHGRRVGHPHPDLARQARDRTAGAAADRCRDEVGGRYVFVAMGYRPDNPAGDALGQALGRQQAIVQHMRALPHGAVADALATVRASQASVTTKRAFEFLVLTAARSGEVRLATWDEMDLDAGVWTIPAARMKAPSGITASRFQGGRSRSCTTHRDGVMAPASCSAVCAGSHSPT